MMRLEAAGMVNCLGDDPASVYRRLVAGDRRGVSSYDGYLTDRPVYLGRADDPPPLPGYVAAHDSRLTRLLAKALSVVARETAAAVDRHGAGRVGVVMGSSTSGIGDGEEAYAALVRGGDFPEGFHYRIQELGAVSDFVSDYFGLRGPSYTVSTACTSGAKVFASAALLLETGVCDAVVVGGADALCALTVRGFASLGLVSPRPCVPMSRCRDGLNLGEGACVFLATRRPGGVRVVGVGETSDAYHMSAPDPSGAGAARALRAALARADARPEDVRYVNLHGTGTTHNDAAEARAVAEVLGAGGYVCGSTKQMTGHLLGAAGATEAGFCYSLLSSLGDRKSVPPHLWDGEADPELPALPLAGHGDTVRVGPGDVVVSTSFAFGGSNCAVALRAGPE